VAFRNGSTRISLPILDGCKTGWTTVSRCYIPSSSPELEDEVALRFYRLQKISEGSINLEEGEAEPLKGPTEVGTRRAEDKEIPLSKLVDKLNDRFGTDFKQADQLFFDQVAEAALENETLKTAAQVNTIDNFKHVFDKLLEGLFIDRMEGNEEIFDRIMNDPQFRNLASAHLMRDVYERVRKGEETKP
jgi:type I restriction enzyme R subunit